MKINMRRNYEIFYSENLIIGSANRRCLSE